METNQPPVDDNGNALLDPDDLDQVGLDVDEINDEEDDDA